MAIMVQGIKIRSINMEFNKETGKFDVKGNYELLSNTGHVLAKQGFNGYNDVKLPESGVSLTNMEAYLNSVSADLNKVLGLE